MITRRPPAGAARNAENKIAESERRQCDQRGAIVGCEDSRKAGRQQEGANKRIDPRRQRRDSEARNKNDRKRSLVVVAADVADRPVALSGLADAQSNRQRLIDERRRKSPQQKSEYSGIAVAPNAVLNCHQDDQEIAPFEEGFDRRHEFVVQQSAQRDDANEAQNYRKAANPDQLSRKHNSADSADGKGSNRVQTDAPNRCVGDLVIGLHHVAQPHDHQQQLA